MRNKIFLLKITICAAFLFLFGAAMFFSQTSKTAAIQTAENALEKPQNCAACHQADYDSWHQTSHQKTVRKASVENIKGDFTVENHLKTSVFKAEMTTDGASFSIRIGDDLYKIAAVVGVKYVEQYVGEKDGEFYSLPIGYNLTENRWVHLNDTDFAKKDANFSRHLQNWKSDCAACHQPSENVISNDFQTFGISCSACHGNAAEHLQAKNSLWAKFGFQTENKIVNPRNLSSDDSMATCANCHSGRLNEAKRFMPASTAENVIELVSAHERTDFDSEKYWSNGEHKFSGNEFPAIVRSVCYTQSKTGGHGIAGEKINCASCHSQHETKADFSISEKDQNQNCINCHTQFSDDSAIIEHTKHPLDSKSSNCASCHQPEIVYGRTRFIRTHEISVPNPFLTVEKQIPNACNLCHTDQSVNWAIASGKKLWSERFRDVKTSPDKQFDKPEGIRALSSDNAFLRALATEDFPMLH